MNRCEQDRLQDYALETLAPEERREVDAHVRDCSACARRLEDYIILFRGLREMQFPPVPAGIADAVLARLPVRLARPSLVGLLLRRPLLAGTSGAALALLIVALQHPLALLFGRVAGGITAEAAGQLVTWIEALLERLADLTVFAHVLLGALIKLEPVVRVLVDALFTIPDRYVAFTIGLFLATALGIGLLLGQVRREKLGHAKF